MTNNTVYFSQHGQALSKEVDANQPLSETGIKQTTSIGNFLRQSKLTSVHIFHSGKLRAEQTAKVYAETISLDTQGDKNTASFSTKR